MATVLWLTSRSAFERGTQYCPYARFVENHAGPFGYGMQRKSHSLPLVSGTYTHLGITSICQWIKDARLKTGHQPENAPDEVVRWAVELSIEKYRKTVEKRGILGLIGDDEEQKNKLQALIIEQEHLISGLIWAWALVRLPAILNEYYIVEVEAEEIYVTDCNCGIGDGIGSIEDHEARDCQGIGLMSRPDLLLERKLDSKFGYSELKTVSVAKKAWNDSWEHKQQFLMGILGAERRFDVEITHAQVEGLIKGQRKREYPYTDDMPKIQNNPFCYAYHKPGNPPASYGEWRPAYNYITNEGLKYTVSRKEYKKIALWSLPEEDAFPGRPPEMSPVEFWAKVMMTEFPYHLEKCVSSIGPIPKQVHQIEKALRSLVAEERLWQDRLWKIYDFSQRTGKEWGDDDFMAFVETVVPRSWNCDPYGPDHPCPNQYICHPITDDWRDPIGSGIAVYRKPHHQPELEQAKARGLAPEDSEGWTDDDDPADDGGDYGSD